MHKLSKDDQELPHEVYRHSNGNIILYTNTQRERLFCVFFFFQKTKCGHHVFWLSQQSLLKFNLTHSPLLVPSPALKLT